VSIRGKVGGPGFVPGTAYPLTLVGKSLMAPIQSRLSPDGSFELHRILPGDYTLTVTGPANRKIELHVGTTDLTDIDVAMPAMKDVSARVVVDRPQAALTGGPQPAATAAGAAAVILYFTAGLPRSFELAWTDASGTTSTTATRQPDGTFQLRLPEGERNVKVDVPGYAVKSFSYGPTDVLKDPVLRVSSADTQRVEMTLVPSAQGMDGAFLSGAVSTLTTTAQNLTVALSTMAAGVAGVVTSRTGVASAIVPNGRVYVGADVARANLLSSVPPQQVPAAAGVRDSVLLRVEIDKEGIVTNVIVIRGNPQLTDAAVTAVKQWRYRPQLLNGQATAVSTTVRIDE
jgi:TonB family protein